MRILPLANVSCPEHLAPSRRPSRSPPHPRHLSFVASLLGAIVQYSYITFPQTRDFLEVTGVCPGNCCCAKLTSSRWEPGQRRCGSQLGTSLETSLHLVCYHLYLLARGPPPSPRCPPSPYLKMNDVSLGDDAHVFQIFLFQKQQPLACDVVVLKQACVSSHLYRRVAWGRCVEGRQEMKLSHSRNKVNPIKKTVIESTCLF